MALKKYKGYTIRIVGLSHHIYHPSQVLGTYSSGYEMSMAAAKRWINEDIRRRGLIHE